ncbi:MAG TPA: hypothetical protein PK324_15065, partial [Nocardioides sp.]|nr:hypothetical protein [Nocardioides sp.]
VGDVGEGSGAPAGEVGVGATGWSGSGSTSSVQPASTAVAITAEATAALTVSTLPSGPQVAVERRESAVDPADRQHFHVTRRE